MKKNQKKIGWKKKIPEGQCDVDYNLDYHILKAICDESFFDHAFLKQLKKVIDHFQLIVTNAMLSFAKADNIMSVW